MEAGKDNQNIKTWNYWLLREIETFSFEGSRENRMMVKNERVCDKMIVERPWLKLETETRVRRAWKSLHLLFLSTKGFKWLRDTVRLTLEGRSLAHRKQTNWRKLRLEAENTASWLLHAGTALVNAVICERCKLALHLSSTEGRWWDW